QPDLPEGYLGRIATLQVFTYRFKDDAGLRLVGPNGKGGQFWEPSFAGTENRSVNLHIFAAPEREHGLSHVGGSFENLIGLFDGVNLKVPQLFPRSELHASELPPGVSDKETEDLALRRRRLERLARIIKEDRDANLLYFDTEALDPDPLGCLNYANLK